jgi:hypothetical protein
MLPPGRAEGCGFESTDFDGAILEIAVIDAATGAVLLDTLVDPGAVPIHPAAAAVHGINADQLVAPPTGRRFIPSCDRVGVVGDHDGLIGDGRAAGSAGGSDDRPPAGDEDAFVQIRRWTAPAPPA